jgi:DNA invertase Pin-like site-specific DNA recombinase
MRILAYIRVSTEGQAESGAGLDAQLSACENYAKRQGLPIHQIYRDEAISGASDLEGRPGLMEALNSLKKGDILLCAKLDRLARGDHMGYLSVKVSQKKAKIISAAGEGTEGDLDDPMTYMMRVMTVGFAGFERLLIKSRTKAALQAMKRDGKRVGHIPFGFKLAQDGIYLEESAEEQDILRQMNELRADGLSIRDIARALNERKAFNRGQSKWNHASVHRILKMAA